MKYAGEILREEYGEKVYKLSLSSGCTCPNRDGKLSCGGCAFCSSGGSGEFAASAADLDTQLAQAKALISRKTAAKLFIAYFQAYTNTYGDLERLEKLYTDTVSRPEIAILSLGTRPDCLGPEVMEMLARLKSIKPLWIELGLQTARDDVAEAMNRGYPLCVFEDSYSKLKRAGISVIIHLIFGLPGETKSDMLNSVRYISSLSPPPDGVKLQMLNILRGSRLGEEYERRPFPLLSREEYAQTVAEAIALLPPETAIHRMTGDGPASLIIAPDWVRDKKKTLGAITEMLKQKGLV